jgi:ubiquinone biosynthesis protein UbiJ
LYQIPQQKIQNLNTRINTILKTYPKKIPIKMLASIKGKVIAMSIVEKQLKILCQPIDQQISITLLRK